MVMKRATHVLIVAGVVILLSTCTNFFASLEPKLIEVSGPQFILSWNPPRNRFIEEGREPDHYVVYYRGFGDTGPGDWTALGSVAAADNPELTVTSSEVSPGMYLFAVTTVDVYGTESDLHQSIDPDADPRRGWILNYLGG